MKIIAENKSARFHYDLLNEWKAGIVLTGPEIKSIRSGKVGLKGAYVTMLENAAYLKNAHIAKYPYDQNKNYDPFRDRKLLLSKKELEKIGREVKTKGATVVALAIGLEGRYAKALIALGRGKKLHDKRRSIKEREEKRKVERAVKRIR